LTLRGAAPGAYTAEALKAEIVDMVATVAKVVSLPFKAVPLDDIETTWGNLKGRIVVKDNVVYLIEYSAVSSRINLTRELILLVLPMNLALSSTGWRVCVGMICPSLS